MKKHFIFLGKAGLIYFCWLFILLFVGLIIAYEGTEKVNWLAIIFIVLFFMIGIYTWFQSYYDDTYLKLPYRTKIKLSSQPEKIWSWKWLTLEKYGRNSVQSYYLLRIQNKKEIA